MIIYKLTNTITGKCYVGQTSKALSTRWSQHVYSANRKNTNSYLHKAINKYGPDCWKKEVLETCLSKKEMEQKELFWINTLKSDFELYNLTSETSVSGRPWTEEEKKTRFKSCKPAAVVCLNNNEKYVSIKEAALALGLKYTSVSAVVLGKKNSIKGFVFDYLDPVKKNKSDEVRLKRRQNAIAKGSVGIKILNPNTGEIFNSIKSASRKLGVPESTIGRFLKENHGFGGNLNLRYMEK